MTTWAEEKDKLTKVISEFPSKFKLRAFPGKEFHLSLISSYIRDNGEIILYCQVWMDDHWEDHTKGTPEEFRKEIIK